jgi:hypothetical protein
MGLRVFDTPYSLCARLVCITAAILYGEEVIEQLQHVNTIRGTLDSFHANMLPVYVCHISLEWHEGATITDLHISLLYENVPLVWR